MTIEMNKNGGELKVCLEGRLDTTTSPELEEKLKGELEGVTALEFDIKDLEYISSAGLRVFLQAQKVMNKQGSMVIHNASEDVMEIFDVTGFSNILTIE